MTHKESQLQRNCVKWCRYAYPKNILFAIPNGGRRGKIEAGIMKAEGVLAGVADLFLMTARNGYNGLFIEMKVGYGKQTPIQKEFEKAAIDAGYRYAVCRSMDEFMETVNDYLNINELKIKQL
ncbi:MAG: VRR-NUC domain-containing protein [Prevotellaceae bacterium]|jgi:hypothetical protein|nr:VRR-NUC domain-containing protein [Prevotellaceae bacterium]